jgi:hypothetical protein
MPACPAARRQLTGASGLLVPGELARRDGVPTPDAAHSVQHTDVLPRHAEIATDDLNAGEDRHHARVFRLSSKDEGVSRAAA